MSRGDHSALVRRARATRGRVPHHPRGLSRWSGYSETTRVDKFQTSPLTSRLSETSTGAGLSRHDDVERTSLMLAIVATMRGLDICDVSHHRCASVGFGWHRRDDLSIPRCVDHQNGPCRGQWARQKMVLGIRLELIILRVLYQWRGATAPRGYHEHLCHAWYSGPEKVKPD